mmetsp:Transcript_72354/g.125521  ORF Transcript_72354/g.125521 Transcript_72354/m.125521 type:complete len:410 (+) Transcript_72354:96-1325(+)
MAPKGNKRAAQVSKAAPPAKVKKVEEPKTKKEEEPKTKKEEVPKYSDPLMEGVANAIQQAELPEACKEMLLIMFPGSLELPLEERHEFHAMVVRMVGDSIQETHSKMIKEVEEAGSAVEAAKAKNTDLEATAVEAESKLKVAGETVQSKETGLQEAAALASNKQTSFDDAKEAQTKGDAESEALKQEKQTYVSALENNFKALSEGNFEGEQAAEHYKVIEPLIANLPLDESLRLALPSTCQKKPGDRGSFDNVIMEQLEKALQTRSAALGEQINAGAAAAEERAAAVQAAEQELQAAKDAKETAQKDLQDAKTKRDEAYELVKSSKKAVAEGVKELEGLTKSHDDKLKVRTHFENWNMSSFAQLKDKSAAPKEEEVPAPMEVTESSEVTAPKEMIVEAANSAPVIEAGA